MKLEKLVWEWQQSRHKLCIRVNITGQIRFLQSLCQRDMVQEEATVMEDRQKIKGKAVGLWDGDTHHDMSPATVATGSD